MRNRVTASLIFLTTLLIFTTNLGAAEKMKSDNPVYVMKTSLGDIHIELFKDAAPETVANFIGLAEGSKEFTDSKTGKKTTRPFYENLIFHRVIKNFMIQGGCPLGTGTGGPGYKFADEINAVSLGLDKLKAMDPAKGPHSYLMINSEAMYHQYIFSPLLNSMNITSQEELDKKKPEVEKKLFSLTLQDVYEHMGYVYSEKSPSHHLKRGCLAMANSGPNTNGSQFFLNLVDTDWLTGKHTVFGEVVKGMDVVDKIGGVEVDKASKPLKDIKIISISRLQ